MQRWGLFGIVFLFSVNIAVAQSVNFTVTLSGPAAPVGRLFIFSEDKGEILTSLGACPFQIADGDVSSLDVFGPLSADQQTCSFPVNPGTRVVVYALKNPGWSDLTTASLWMGSFDRFEGACSGVGNGEFSQVYGINSHTFPVWECGISVLDKPVSLTVFYNTEFGGPTPVPTATPDANEMEDFVDARMDSLKKGIRNLGISKIAAKGSVKLNIPPCPDGGTLSVTLTTRVRVSNARAAVVQPAYVSLVLARGKAVLSPTAGTSMRLKFSSKGRRYLKPRTQVKGTLEASWVAPEAGTSSLSLVQSILMRRR